MSTERLCFLILRVKMSRAEAPQGHDSACTRAYARLSDNSATS